MVRDRIIPKLLDMLGRGIIIAVPLAILCLGGCGDTKSDHSGSAVTSSSYVANVEHQCGVVYTRPHVVGEALGFTCGETASGERFGVIYTRLLRCSPFATIVATAGKDRAQGCISPTPRRSAGTVTCESGGTVTVTARTLPQIWSATVRLSSGKEATANILSLNAKDRERWGGVYFNVLRARTAAKAVLSERDRSGRVRRRLLLTSVGNCV